MYKKRFDSKDKVNFRAYDVATLLTNNYIHILPNMSRSKIKETAKLGQLIWSVFLLEVKATGLKLRFNIFR